jgi:hypothetical protein
VLVLGPSCGGEGSWTIFPFPFTSFLPVLEPLYVGEGLSGIGFSSSSSVYGLGGLICSCFV